MKKRPQRWRRIVPIRVPQPSADEITGTPAGESLPLPQYDATADLEYSMRLQADQLTAEFATPSTKPLDAGKKEIADAPLFGGERQGSLFDESNAT